MIFLLFFLIPPPQIIFPTAFRAIFKKPQYGLPRWVKNPPANAGHMGLIPGLGGFRMPWSNQAHVPELLSLCSRTHEPQLPVHVKQQVKPVGLDPALPNKRSHHSEKPLSPQLEKARVYQQTPDHPISK